MHRDPWVFDSQILLECQRIAGLPTLDAQIDALRQMPTAVQAVLQVAAVVVLQASPTIQGRSNVSIGPLYDEADYPPDEADYSQIRVHDEAVLTEEEEEYFAERADEVIQYNDRWRASDAEGWFFTDPTNRDINASVYGVGGRDWGGDDYE